ncbi:hypothetical protein BJF85_01220 [Saccharomonospora sp. CUA-673]|uniref:hypothetical protein n=1 Tax=Saccharomonospora sp. CUA-673 TaxID=1904969 RepID=UPI000962D064|nr:hypothetical protein [Saccharomonospora sp. CUA-673]OLT47055.1 hypothetical protein BJF85_01220 [Saccharomonospora sp. CUA-673]
MNETQTAPGTAKRWTKRGLAVGALTVPMLAILGGTASAAELAPIAEYLDETVAATSASVVDALAILLGVS